MINLRHIAIVAIIGCVMPFIVVPILNALDKHYTPVAKSNPTNTLLAVPGDTILLHSGDTLIIKRAR